MARRTVVGSKRTGAMDLVDLHYLSVAVETGSFSHAAQSLGVKP
jgi:DNA-binding transcriptional LysR family regulator